MGRVLRRCSSEVLKTFHWILVRVLTLVVLPCIAHADLDCIGVPAAEKLYRRLLKFPALWELPRSLPECPRVEVRYRQLRLGRLERDSLALANCEVGLLTSNLSTIVSVYAWAGSPGQVRGYRNPPMGLVADETRLVGIFGSRWPVFSLLAWLQAFVTCGAARRWFDAAQWDCADALEPYGVRENSMKYNPDQTYWQAALDLSVRVAAMKRNVVWINAARLAFEPAITLPNMMRLAALSCPIGAATIITLHGVFYPFGGAHFGSADEFIRRIAKALVDGRMAIGDVVESSWPLPAILWQLSLFVDRKESTLRQAAGIHRYISDYKEVLGTPIGSCELGRRAALVTRVDSAQTAFLGAWVDMVRRSHFDGLLVIIHRDITTCWQTVRADDMTPNLCVEGQSKTQEYEALVAVQALLEKGCDSVVLVDFDAIILGNVVHAISDIMCSFDRPRPSMYFHRPHTLPAGEADYSPVRFLRGDAGLALVRNFLWQALSNPFLRPLGGLSHMEYEPNHDANLPPASFADTDGFPDLESVVSLASSSPWLTNIYRGIWFGSAERRVRDLTKLCNLRLVPACFPDIGDNNKDSKGFACEECVPLSLLVREAIILDANKTSSWGNGRWALRFASLFEWGHGRTTMLRPRVFQIGPSSAATTSIRDYFVAHGLRAAKTYHRDNKLMDLIEEALAESRPALTYVDVYDAYTDFIYPFDTRIPWCADGCAVRNLSVAQKLKRYFELVSILAAHYPYSKFVFNTRSNFERWLAAQMPNCWRWIDQKEDFGTWKIRYDYCCDSKFGSLGNQKCWANRVELHMVPTNDDMSHDAWACKVCCHSMHAYTMIWTKMHEGIEKLFAHDSARVLFFQIERGSKPMEQFLGISERAGAWHQAHAG